MGTNTASEFKMWATFKAFNKTLNAGVLDNVMSGDKTKCLFQSYIANGTEAVCHITATVPAVLTMAHQKTNAAE
jgi:hypothetical protein